MEDHTQREGKLKETPLDPNERATKSDSAQVRTELWDSKVLQGLSFKPLDHSRSLHVLRNWLLTVWRRGILLSYCAWERTTLQKDIPDCEWYKYRRCNLPVKRSREIALECIQRACNSSWWNWDSGSRPFFWRWPDDYHKEIRDGVKGWYSGGELSWKRKQRGPGSVELIPIVHDKLATIRDKGYVEVGPIWSLMPFFNVPKGKDDVRMVYDGTKSGLNDHLFAPWFSLPTVDMLVRSLDPGYYMADNDVREIFHNFILHQDLRKYCGLDLSLYFRKDPTASYNHKGQMWERWNRLAMGLRLSPYCAVQGMMIAKEVILGDSGLESNVFRWDKVLLNLPGEIHYDSSKSWVSKVRRDGNLAADVFIYVDDVRSSAPTEAEAWLASQRTSSILGFLGLQDAARKRREPGQEPGAWTGSVVWTTNGSISVLTTQEKWDKTKPHIQWMQSNLNNHKGMNGKIMRSIRGFLVYVARTYPSMVPYLKGIHATIDSWRPGRNADGWKYPGPRDQWHEEDGLIEVEQKFGMDSENNSEPEFVFPVPRLANDVQSQSKLVEPSKPPLRTVRMKSTARVVYGFGDASKQGFGSTIVTPDGKIHWTSGHWTLDQEQQSAEHVDGARPIVYERSSNYRELRNLVEELEKAYKKGLLDDREIFMFTDNSTAESAYFKGTSSSELLFGLVLHLRKIEMSGKCILHMVHVAGTRMICQGTDGLSRGDRNVGVMAGESMLTFIPLHLSASDRSSSIVHWVSDWVQSEEGVNLPCQFLTHDDWPTNLITVSTYVWIPPLAAADVAAEFMAQSIHKRSSSTHIFICPRLMTARWFRLVIKSTDLVLRVPVGCDVWNSDQHEPLILAISLPLSREYPWRHKLTPQLGHDSRNLQAMLSGDFQGSSSLLRQLMSRARHVARL
jgi:hypothetical protein